MNDLVNYVHNISNNIIKVQKVMEHYEIYVRGKFYCSCDSNELKDTLNEIMDKFDF